MQSTQEQVRIAPVQITAEQQKFYAEEGYLIIRGLISPEDAALLRREVLDIMDIIGLPLSKLRQTREYLAGSNLDAFVNSPELLSLAEQLMGGPGRLYLPFTAVKSGGGGGQFHFHQDNQYTRFDGPGINLWCALQPMDEQNGCIQLVPRSHLNGTYETGPAPDGDNHRVVPFEPSDFIQVRMETGDCLAFTRLTVHGSGKNTTEEPRVGYAVQYHRDDVKYLSDGDWKLLREYPRYPTEPVAAITVPEEKASGH